jgi:predicted pyridoxine 5'-phosphate oxidase superfamily flavin-nucleotide-binding protein
MEKLCHSSDVAFTPAVKEVQRRKGSRRAYAHMEESGSWSTRITSHLASYIAAQRSVFLATSNSVGQPYVQHRGGPPGFIHVLDAQHLAFLDFAGNRQYITQGNLLENSNALLFLIDYSSQSRVKIWGKAEVIEGDEEMMRRLTPPDYKARGEQVIKFEVAAWDVNCPKHIPKRFEEDEVSELLRGRDDEIERLRSEVEQLRSRLTHQ